MKRKLILLTAVLLAILLLSACSSSDGGEVTGEEEMIELSNTRFFYMELSDEERNQMNLVEDILRNASYRENSKELLAKNDSGLILQDVELYLLYYDSAGVIRNRETVYLGDWLPDTRLEIVVTPNTMPHYDRIEIFACYYSSTVYYRTEMIPLNLAEPESEALPILHFDYDLPLTLRYTNSSETFVVKDFRFLPSVSESSFEITLSKESGPVSRWTYFSWRIMRDGDTVMESGYESHPYMHTGETIQIHISPFDLPPGEYTFEILN